MRWLKIRNDYIFKKKFVWLKGKQLEVPVDSFSFKNKIRMRNNAKNKLFWVHVSI